MSLDIYLHNTKTITCKCGEVHEVETVTVYDGNITGNLWKMADAANIGDPLWEPESLNITKAGQLIQPLTDGLELLKSKPEYFERFNSPNGWGLYKHFVPFVEKYLNACKEYPDAVIEISR